MQVPLSILDLAPISEGSDAATALRNTIDLARHAEQWGYRRYWVAEHHSTVLASSQPAVLIAHIAAVTNHIRVGAAAVQLGQTPLIAVIEAFGTLDAFHPGRIDLGIGRSGQWRRAATSDGKCNATPNPASQIPWREVDGVTIPPPFEERMLMRNSGLRAKMSVQQPEAVAPDFGKQVGDILALIDGHYAMDGMDAHATPGEGAALTPWVCGSSKDHSAKVAGAKGLPFIASYHITPATALDAIEAYRAAFTPSARLAHPYVAVSADVVVADDTATARRLASSYGHWVLSVRVGDGAVPYPDPDSVAPLTEEEAEAVRDRTATQFVGDPDEVAHRLDALQRVTGADEVIVTSITHRHADRLRSHELLARRWAL